MNVALSPATRRLVVLCGLTLSAATLSAPACADEDNSRRIDRFISDPGLLIYSAAGVGLPLLLTDGKAGREQSLRTVDALLVGGIAETALKRLTREKRPEGSGYSFPSGHAVASFAVATMQSHYHPKQAPFWYAGAALISASRVTLRRHYVHDVLAGAALGYGIARFELKRPRGILLTPFIPDRRDRKGGGFGLQLTKAF